MTTERVRAKVHEAAGLIEVPAYDPQAIAAAARSPQRRPWVPLAAAAATVGAVLGATAWLTLGEADEPQPAGALDQATTPAALVAIALDHISVEPSYYEAQNRSQDPGVSAAIRFGADGEYDGDQLSLYVIEGSGPDWGACNEYDDGCATIATNTGDVTLSWQELEPEEDPGIVYVSQERDDGFAMVGYSGRSILGDPREQTLPVSVEEMVEIVSDPAYGPVTTAEYAAAAERIDWDFRAGETAGDGSGQINSTGSSLAAAVEEHLRDEGLGDRILSGREAAFVEPAGEVTEGFGIEVRLEGGYTLYVNVFAAEGQRFLACQPTLTCWDFEGLTLVGRAGLAGAFRSDTSATVHTWVEGPGIDPDGPASFGLGNDVVTGPVADLLAATARLANAPGIALFTEQQWLDAGDQVTWFTVQGEGDPEG